MFVYVITLKHRIIESGEIDDIPLKHFIRSSIPIKISSVEVQDFLEKIKDYSIEITEMECEGCRNESLGQSDHIDCPSGCLHDYNECGMC